MRKLFISLLVFAYVTSFAQLSVTFPINRAVFQRNGSNEAIMPIGGTFQQRVERIDARLIAINGGRTIDWTTIDFNPTGGGFRGALAAIGGWYRLEVRAVVAGNVVSFTSVDKVGIGEVFVVSGQSNAQGYTGRGNPPATDDRVNCISNFYTLGQAADPPFPQISQLSENTIISPSGNGSWCWGRLGDMLAQRLNVPILFINNAHEAMGVEDWSRSANGERGYNIYTNKFTDPGYPYQNLQKSLQHYVNMFGIRTILWLQGETDTDRRTSTQRYREALEYVIHRSRIDVSKNISWVICRTSFTSYNTSQAVINAQNLVIQNYFNVFEGPETDKILNRPDGVHIEGLGLTQLAEAWNEKLNTNFFAASNPIQASFPLSFALNCNIENLSRPLRLSMPEGFNAYSWTNGSAELSNSISFETSLGFYRGKAIDYLGNVYYTVGVNYSSIPTVMKPTLFTDGPTTFCEGGSVRLSSSLNQNINWSVGGNSQSIVVSQPGTYFVSQSNYLGCSATSNAVNVSFFPKPNIQITPNGSTTFCADQSLNLSSNLANNIRWNSGEVTQTISVNRSGEYFVTAKNEFGCENTSSKINITVNPVPTKPIITAAGPTLFCADKSVTLVSNIKGNLLWNNGENTNNVVINRTGTYFVNAKNEFGCQTGSNIIDVKVNPLPPKPNVIAGGPTTFCDGESVTLATEINTGYIWSNGITTSNQVVKSSGFYSVKAIDSNGCISPVSNEVPITVKPAPLSINILQSGTYTLEALTNELLDLKYEWAKDGVKLPDDGMLIKAKLSGAYTTRGSILYQLGANQTLRCFSPVSKPYNFVVDPTNQGLSVFPNPVPKDFVNIETIDEHENVAISFYDLRGIFIKEITIPKVDSRKTLDLKGMQRGQFILHFKSKDLSVMKKIILD
jgi:Carbohydrate esterase, sialic acid-specific acetylesterase/Secretion system C-terminal sorting domain